MRRITPPPPSLLLPLPMSLLYTPSGANDVAMIRLGSVARRLGGTRRLQRAGSCALGGRRGGGLIARLGALQVVVLAGGVSD